MQVLTRRELFWMMSGASLSCKRRDPGQAGPIVDFLKVSGKGRTFASISEGRAAKPGDVILVRELTQIAPSDAWVEKQIRGKWQLRPYQLANGQSG